ncbi:MAG: 30S ribosomal protein S1 [Clostridia bacterium]|nr:30S ribosomal protein S1 [Clostridia bacterium]
MTDYRPEGRIIYDKITSGSVFSAAALHELMLRGTISEARALLCDNEHNLHVNLGSMRGIIPRDECALGIKEGTVRDIAIISRVNKPVCFKVLEIEEGPSGVPFAVLSRRLAQQECMNEYISKIRCGDIINAVVTHLEPFGAFCDIGCGISALLPVDGISVSRIPHPAARLSVGKDIKAVVRSIDETGRVTLSMKELLGTWEENAAMFSVGETVPGIVRSVESYGIFVELTPNLAGLAELTDGIEAGHHCSVFIKNIIPEKMKVKLIIVDSFLAPFTEPETKYFFSGKHIDSFQYSPANSEKLIKSVF